MEIRFGNPPAGLLIVFPSYGAGNHSRLEPIPGYSEIGVPGLLLCEELCFKYPNHDSLQRMLLTLFYHRWRLKGHLFGKNLKTRFISPLGEVGVFSLYNDKFRYAADVLPFLPLSPARVDQEFHLGNFPSLMIK
jgi:hypothetical protein